MKRTLLVGLALLLAASLAFGQAPPEQPAQYDITVNIELGKSATITAPSNRVTMHPGFLPHTTIIEIDTRR